MTAALYTCAWRNPACPHAGQRPKARPARKAWTGTRARHAERSPARVRQQPKVRKRCSIPWMQVWVQLQRLAAVGLFDLDAGVALQGKPRSSKGLAERTCTRRRSSRTGALKTEAAGRGSIVAACTTDDLARVVGTSWVRPRTTREVRASKNTRRERTACACACICNVMYLGRETPAVVRSGGGNECVDD